MLRSAKNLIGYHVAATDGDIGKVRDFYFDDSRWAIRYLVADTSGFWQESHRVLVSPVAFQRADWNTRKFHLTITKERVRTCPSIDFDKPVSRQEEQAYHRHYGWAPYWGFGESWIWGIGDYPSALAKSDWHEPRDGATDEKLDSHLRSTNEVRGYQINGGKNEREVLGQVVDFIVDDETWAVRYLVLDTDRWWTDKKVLVAPHWASRISWREETIYTKISRETIQHSPAWNPEELINREYEARLFDYYGRPAYWVDGGPTSSGAATAAAAPLPTLPTGVPKHPKCQTCGHIDRHIPPKENCPECGAPHDWQQPHAANVMNNDDEMVTENVERGPL